MDFSKYIDSNRLENFKKSLSSTRKIIGSKNLKSMDDTYGVAGNTFRAYSGFDIAPSTVFREWAERETRKIICSPPVSEIDSKDNFCLWHLRLASSLDSYWLKKQKRKLSFAHKFKLIDLYIKWLSQFKLSDSLFIENLNKFASCALDSQTLDKINLCFGKLLPINKPSMGHIFNRNTYDFSQFIILQFCDMANATRLEFDYWAWKKGSGNKVSKRIK